MRKNELKCVVIYLLTFSLILGVLLGFWIYYITHYESKIRDQIQTITEIHVAEIRELEDQITSDPNLSSEQKIYLHRVLADYSRGHHSEHYWLLKAGLNNASSFEELIDALDTAHDKAVLYEFHIKEMEQKHSDFVSEYPNKILFDRIHQKDSGTTKK